MGVPVYVRKAFVKALRRLWILPILFVWELLKDRIFEAANDSIDEASPAMIKGALGILKTAADSPIAWSVAIAIVVTILIFAHAYWKETREPQSSEKTQSMLAKLIPTAEESETLSLQEAARLAYEEAQGSAVMGEIEKAINDQNKMLGYMGGKLLDGGMLVRGTLHPSQRPTDIPPEEATVYAVSDDATEIFDRFNETRRYRNLEVSRSDFLKRLDDLKRDWGIIQDKASTPAWHVVQYVAWHIVDEDENNCFPSARSQIRQQALNGCLKVRGRMQVRMQFSGESFSDVYSDVSQEYWAQWNIDALATSPAYINMYHTISEDYPRTDGRPKYADLRFDWNEVLKLWPVDNI